VAASPGQREIAADALRAGHTQAEAARRADLKSVSTIKRWLKEPAFQALLTGSPDIRPGPPPRLAAEPAAPDLQLHARSRIWLAAEGTVLGSLIAPAALASADGVLHVHRVEPEAVPEVVAAIEARAYPADSPYIPVSLAGLDELLENLPLVCRLASPDARESLNAWLELWTFIDEDGRTRTLAEALWQGQRRFLETLVSTGHVLSIKSRKVGLSTLVCAHAAWTAQIRDLNASVHLLSYREDAARELLRGLRRGFDGLPSFLGLPLERETSTVLVYAASPGDTRSLKAFPATPTAAIEATCSHLVLDEWAHTFDPEALWEAVEPTLPARASSALITTARSPGDFVHDYWRRSEAGETRHRAVFVSALERSGRSPAWLEQKRREEGKWRSLRNYPVTAEDAFAAAGEPYFAAELLEAAQQQALPPSPAQKGDRYLKAWDIGRKDASVCVVLRAPSPDAEVWHVVDYRRLVGEDYPTIQREIETMQRRYPGPTVVEANSIGLPLIQNLSLPESELIEQTTTQASKQAMLTEIELLLQQQTLKIHPEFHQLLAELADYRLPDSSLTQDSVMALGFAVANGDQAHAVRSGGRVNRELFYELNNLGPRPEWYGRPKFGDPAAGLIPGHRAPDAEHGGIRLPYQAEVEEVPDLLAHGWTPDDPTILDELDLSRTPTKTPSAEAARGDARC
jgi:hypothetical protein